MAIRTLSGFTLPRQAEFARAIVSPRSRQTGDFDQEYDFHTLFYDAFYVPDRAATCLMAPPLLNFKQSFRRAEWRADGQPLRISAQHPPKLHYWHCYGVSTSWKFDRTEIARDNLIADSETAAVLGSVFGDRQQHLASDLRPIHAGPTRKRGAEVF